MLWIEEQHHGREAEKLSQSLGVSELISSILIARGLDNPYTASEFLSPKLYKISDPFEVPNLRNAISRIADALKLKERILIVGDYDVDGITSTVIVKQVLSYFGLEADYVIPHRNEEGYGLTMDVLNRGMQSGDFSLVIALDCGTNSLEEANFLNQSGVDLVIVDHHKSKGEISPHPIFLNPHLNNEEGTPWHHFCTAGLCFKLIHGLIKLLRQEGLESALQKSPKDYLALAALGTLADMVPLIGENRILASFGLKHLRARPSQGLKSLIKVAKFNTKHPFEAEDITFRIAPRINACGRLNNPEIAAKLLLAENMEVASALAQKMDEFNEKRKDIETFLTKNAQEQADEKFESKPAAVLYGKGKEWNPGVVGIVAGKLVSKLQKPCLVLAYDDGKYKGSGRSIDGINLIQALHACEDLLESWGGHPLAVGLSIDESNVDEFEKEFVSFIDKNHEFEKLPKRLKIDAIVNLEDLSQSLLDEISMLAPFGQENPEPLLAIKSISLDLPARPIGNGKHFQFMLNSGSNSVSGIAWNMIDRIPPTHRKLDLAFKLRWNRWNNKNTPQIILEDWKLSDEN